MVNPIAFDQVFQYSIKESDIATSVDLEEIVGDLGAEQSALGHRRYPVPLQAGLAVGIDHEHLSSGFLGVVEVLGCYRLIVRQVRSHQNNKVRTNPIGIGTSRCGAAHGGL